MRSRRAQKGFTLIELIVTIMVVGVLSSMVVPYFLSGVTKGADPLNEMPTPLGLQSVMAAIVADYYSSGTYMNDLAQLNASIVTGKYGITAGHTVTKDPNYKFDPADANNALKVTIRDNATNQTVTYVFTKQL